MAHSLVTKRRKRAAICSFGPGRKDEISSIRGQASAKRIRRNSQLTLNDFGGPKTNTVFCRYKFHNHAQSEVETVEQFVTDLKLLARDCAFKEPDKMIRDRIVFGTNSQKLINQGKDSTLDKAVKIA